MKNNLVWIDLETTGLNVDVDVIVEIATIVTDKNLEIIEEGPDLVINQDLDSLDTIDPWARKQHTQSGLWDQILNSQISLGEAEQQSLDFIKKHTEKNANLLCGNSIWLDRHFLRKYMKELESYLHYRVIDVTSIKELVSRWYGDKYTHEKRKKSHRALDDIRGSIDELRFYRETVFKNSV